MSSPHLPEPIAAHVAVDTLGPDAVARCFTATGVVTDKRQTHLGRQATMAWKAGTCLERGLIQRLEIAA